jgi:hypothetical protein
MLSQNDTKRQVTLRLPDRLLRQVRRIAARKRLSLNGLLRSALEKMAEEERQAVLRASYDLLGADADEADVEDFLQAQAEVVRRE